ncbi:hypothetical protein L1987_03868 [Smallanthus sonchifolius]|uniref:Uncharacterized protein n=1 Tax=Smallanthus sonchifolius TaxID=185202 RepID=A0ACB9KBT3_9ASTR|nr:hypothetical protein L1987_03868 [Smallanthus sonchifolius]
MASITAGTCQFLSLRQRCTRLLDGEFEETWMKKGNLLLSSLQHPSERPPGSGCGNTGNGGNPCVGSRKVVWRYGDGALPPPLTPSTSIDH